MANITTNTIPCGQCVFCDPILKGPGKITKRGWCMKRSKYPHTEGPGQVFPKGVDRVALGALAEPFIVRLTDIMAACPFVERKT